MSIDAEIFHEGEWRPFREVMTKRIAATQCDDDGVPLVSNTLDPVSITVTRPVAPSDPYADLQRVADLLKTARASGDQYRAATDRLREAMGMSSDELAAMRDRIRALTDTEADRCAAEGHPQLDCSTIEAGGSICRCGAEHCEWERS